MKKAACLLILLFLVLTGVGCQHGSYDSRLEEINKMADEDPHIAINLLDSIDKKSLSESNKHYFDLLTVKTKDKAYIRHTNDSLILNVINYYKSNDSRFYPEALYYGGRVYSDLGDYPTALGYFQDALVDLSEDSIELRATILSQTARLLDDIGMPKEAVAPLREALKLDSLLGNKLNIFYDLLMMGHIERNLNHLEQAKNSLINALSVEIPVQDKLYAEISLAYLLLKLNAQDSALKLARTMSATEIDSVGQNYVLACLSKIYLSNNILDTAYYYSKKLIETTRANNKFIGYQNLLDSRLTHFSSTDTLLKYIHDFRNQTVQTLKNKDNELLLEQRSKYNYTLQERQRIKAELDTQKIKMAFLVTLIVLLTGALIFSFYVYKNKLYVLKLKNRIAYIENIRNTSIRDKEDITIIKDQIFSDIHNRKCNYNSRQDYTKFESYQQILDYLKHGKSINDFEPIWSNLERDVNIISPKFRDTIFKLAGATLSQAENNTLLLIKCGFKPTEMAIILGRAKGTISSRRMTLSKKLFGTHLHTKEFDDLIRSVGN